MGGSKQYSRRLPMKRYERSVERPAENTGEDFEAMEAVPVRTDITSNPDIRNTGLAGLDRVAPADNGGPEPAEVKANATVNDGSSLVMNSGLKKIRKKKLRKNGKLG